jgi:hypothetical protein
MATLGWKSHCRKKLVTGLYSVGDNMIDEYGAVGGMRIRRRRQ